MTARDDFGERIPERIVKQTFDIAPPAGEQAIPQERLRARTVEQRWRPLVNYSMQVTMLLLCCRAAHSVRQLPAKYSGLR